MFASLAKASGFKCHTAARASGYSIALVRIDLSRLLILGDVTTYQVAPIFHVLVCFTWMPSQHKGLELPNTLLRHRTLLILSQHPCAFTIFENVHCVDIMCTRNVCQKYSRHRRQQQSRGQKSVLYLALRCDDVLWHGLCGNNKTMREVWCIRTIQWHETYHDRRKA